MTSPDSRPAFPHGLAKEDASYAAWAGTLRPTSLIPKLVSDIGLPPRVISCDSLRDSNKLEFVRPTSWNFAAISHRWDGPDFWEAAPYRPPPGVGRYEVRGTTKESLVALSHLLLSLDPPVSTFWIDTVCTDQKSPIELARSVASMGSYYFKSFITLIFPYRLRHVGPPFQADGTLPVWHSRVWTLQEVVLAGSKAHFVLFDPNLVKDLGTALIDKNGQNLQYRALHNAVGPRSALDKTSHTTPFADFASPIRLQGGLAAALCRSSVRSAAVARSLHRSLRSARGSECACRRKGRSCWVRF